MSDTIEGIVEVPKSEASLLLEAGYLLMELGKHKEAEEVFTGVSALLPKSDVALVALGNFYFAQGKTQRALKFHKEALKVRPGSPLAMAHIGESLLFLKKKEEGIKILNECLSADPEGMQSEFARSLLEAAEAGEL